MVEYLASGFEVNVGILYIVFLINMSSCNIKFEGKYDNKNDIINHIEKISDCYINDYSKNCNTNSKICNDDRKKYVTDFLQMIENFKKAIKNDDKNSILESINKLKNYIFSKKSEIDNNNNINIYFIDQTQKNSNYLFFEELKKKYSNTTPEPQNYFSSTITGLFNLSQPNQQQQQQKPIMGGKKRKTTKKKKTKKAAKKHRRKTNKTNKKQTKNK